MTKRLLLVLAHPDDESMGNGTLIARHVAAGCSVHLICATRGGAGWNGWPPGRSQEELPAIRAEELKRAAKVLGLAGFELWDYPDGAVPGCDPDEITGRIGNVVERLDPDVVVGWGPDGGYGHGDHIAVGACTDRVLWGSGRPHYHMAVDQRMAEAFRSFTGNDGLDEGGIELKPVTHVDAVFEPSREELTAVRRAIKCHESQRNSMIEALLENDRLLFWMARNCYVDLSGHRAEPVTDLLPELR